MRFRVERLRLAGAAAALMVAGGAVAIGAAHPASAQQRDSLWSLYEDPQVLIALDRNSVRWTGNRPTVSWQLVWAVPTPFEQYGRTRYKQRRTETYELDCAGDRVTPLAIVEMTLDGSVLETRQLHGQPEVVDRFSVGAATLEAVCRNNTASLQQFPGTLDEMIGAYLQAASNPPRPPAAP
jgi:hypothetical protein